MNPIELLRAVLLCNFPDAQAKLWKPLHADGFWTMDVELPQDYVLVINWREATGFLLTADEDHGYGEPADEQYKDFLAALTRCTYLLKNRAETVPPYAVRIKELRQKLNLSQEEVAKRMGVNQAAISKLEAREDTHVATLQNYIRALGGRLIMKAAFDGLEKEIELVSAE